MEQIPISVLIETIEAMHSEKSGRFTTGEIEMFGEVLKVLQSFEKLPMDRRKEAVLFIVVHVLRIFMNPDLFREIEHFFKF